MAELTDEPDGYLEHTPLGDFLAYSKTEKNAQTPLYSLEKARTILALSATGAEDAERFRWLLKGEALNVEVPTAKKPVYYLIGPRPEAAWPDAFRAAIDAARTQSNGAAGGGEVSHGE